MFSSLSFSQLLEMCLLSCEYWFLDPIGNPSFALIWLVLGFETGSVLECTLKAASVVVSVHLSNSVSTQKNKWDATRSLRFNQDAQREDGKCYYLSNIKLGINTNVFIVICIFGDGKCR